MSKACHRAALLKMLWLPGYYLSYVRKIPRDSNGKYIFVNTSSNDHNT